MQQLADMGIAIPEEFRRDMAMAGDWQVLSQAPVVAKTKIEGDDDFKAEGDAKSIGVRKRKLDGDADEDDESTFHSKQPKAWGSAFKAYPASTASADDFEALLSQGPASVIKRDSEASPQASGVDEAKIKVETTNETEETGDTPTAPDAEHDVAVKQEVGEQDDGRKVSEMHAKGIQSESGVVFKKRKKKI